MERLKTEGVCYGGDGGVQTSKRVSQQRRGALLGGDHYGVIFGPRRRKERTEFHR